MPLDSYDIQNQSSSSLSKDSPKTDLTVKLKIKKDIEELIKQKDIEIAITEELRKCISAETSNNLVTGKNQFQTYQDLKETLTINDS